MNTLCEGTQLLQGISITRILRCFFESAYVFKNRDTRNIFADRESSSNSPPNDETVWRAVAHFVSRQSYLPCAYTQRLSLSPSSRSVGRSVAWKRPPRISRFAESAQNGRICYSNSNLNSTRRIHTHTHTLHHVKTSRIVAVWHPMCTRPPASCSCSKKGHEWFADMSGSLCDEISRQERTYIWLSPDLSHYAPFSPPVNIAELIGHITWECIQTQDLPILQRNFLSPY